MRLEGQVAAVTGGTRGIGLAIAKAFGAEGACVVINGRDSQKGEKALAELGADGRARFVAGDVMRKADCEAVIDETVESYGRIDILVNNAGGVTSDFGPLVEMTDEAWFHALDWNLNSAFFCTRRALADMVPRGHGRIINISSTEGKIGKPGAAGYSSAKHALNGLTKALSKEVGQLGITVNSICPGLVLTDIVNQMVPAYAEATGLGSADAVIELILEDSATKQPSRADDIAAAAVLLASEAGANITGATISVDGGTAPY